mmetsp:Transcript_90699/g.228079  ORF Transcript_90699/g.228079 Transcript_90699/m.228079 type:complete len:93 (+) Transcript_90699:225-503(+)
MIGKWKQDSANKGRLAREVHSVRALQCMLQMSDIHRMGALPRKAIPCHGHHRVTHALGQVSAAREGTVGLVLRLKAVMGAPTAWTWEGIPFL